MVIPRDHKGLYLCPPNNHGRQSKISGEGATKMITGFVKREEFSKLSKDEGSAFILFLTMEAARHAEDIAVIEEDIRYINKHRVNEGEQNG